MRFSICCFLLFYVISAAAPVFSLAESPPIQEAKPSKFAVTANTVVLDLVVKDKRGRPVKDLSASDFEIYEDGVRQQIESFQWVTRESAKNSQNKNEPRIGSATPPAGTPPDPFAGVSFIALVFDRLSPNARELAHRAALSYVTENVKPDDLVGVFAIDLSLRTLQAYTSNAQLVRQAVDRAASLSTSSFSSSGERVRSLSERESTLQTQAATSEAAAASGGRANAAEAQAAGQNAGSAAANLRLAEMEMRMLETFEALERDQQGYATSNALLAIVNSLRNLSGRKAVLFFSEGLAIPPAVLSHFRSVINAANRANVSIYAMDAAGLRVESANEETRREINALGARRSRQAASGRDDTSGPMIKALERNEDLLRLSPHSGLGQLSEETGGFLIRDTNDLASGMRRIDEDMRAYYLLTYQPKNQDYNGRFRQISVKVNRSNLDVQSRKGYYAIRDILSSPVLEYEVPALAFLNNAPNAVALPVRTIGLNFPEPRRPGLVPVLVEVPASVFSYPIDPHTRAFNTDFSFVVLIRDSADQVVKKLSQHYALTGPSDKVEAARQGDILLYRETQLAPGRYKIEAVAYDALASRAGVGMSMVEVVPGDSAKPQLSSVVLIKRAERLINADQNSANPFHFGEVLIYPNVGEPVRKSVNSQLAFFLTVYPSKETPAAPKIRVELLRDGKSLALSSADLPPADAAGRIQYASTLPVERLPPGDYELKVTVRDQHSSMTRLEHFILEP